MLRHLGVGKACLLGISNGGRIALDFVSIHPEMVEALVLVGTGVRGYQISGPDEEKEWDEFDARVMAKGATKEKAIKEKQLKDAVTINVDLWASAQSPESRERIFKIAMDNSNALVELPWGKLQVSPQPPAFARLGDIKIPTLLIIGDKDVSGTMVTKRLSSIIPGSKMVLLEGADHIVNMSKPREFDRTVLEFLDAVIRQV
ncbi:alpha/beta hydrolase [Candidatus Bathyarchaeota archaeon]|nr:MAG: alpha/beta hydrolase [Candidatus Bathyarchaeota archaeon]